MSEETIELFYISNYEDPETGAYEYDKKGVSIISREAYLQFLHETEYEPCECDVQGCLSCFLDETNGWTDGYGDTCTELWFGVDPATGKQWDPKGVLASRREEAQCQLNQMVWKCPHGCKSTRRYDTNETEFSVPVDYLVNEQGEITNQPMVSEHPVYCLDCGERAEWVKEPDQMVEYDHEKHEGMAQCDACEEWFPPMKTVMVDEKMFIQKCLECYDGEDARAYSFSNDDIYEDYSDEIPPEEEE